MITSNVIHRIFKIRIEASTGTAFTIEHNERQYLVTAKHLIQGLDPQNVRIYYQNEWVELPLSLTGLSGKADVAAFAPPLQLSPTFACEAMSEGLVYGQDVYFVGFPYDIVNNLGAAENFDRPFPLVKKACVSAFAKGDNDESILFLDGHNNPGFSGAPVVFRESARRDFKVCGVVSGYISQPEETRLEGNRSEFRLWQNTGIIVCSDIQHVIELIEENPNGMQITDKT